MSESLPKSGVTLAVENAAQATAAVKGFTSSILAQVAATRQLSGASDKQGASINKLVSNLRSSIKPIKDTSGATKELTTLNKAFSGDLTKIGTNLLQQIPIIGRFSGSLSSILGAGEAAAAGGAAAASGTAAAGTAMSAALPVIGAVVIAVAAATAGFYAFWKIGVRGAQLQPTIDAFGNLAGQFGDSTEILQRLRDQTKGAISDIDLMRITTFALSGTSQELGTILAENLGQNLNDISRLATAIGRDPVEAQNRWIDAIKKGERELLDELGIVVSANQAYEAYAKGINKSVTELTAYDKQAAFAQEATRQLNAAVAKLPDQSGILVTLQRIGVAFQNFKDKFALFIQPIFAPIAQAVSMLVTTIFNGLSTLLNLLKPIINVIGAIMVEVQKTVGALGSALFGDLAAGAGNALNYIIAAVQLISEALIYLIKVIGGTLRATIGVFFAALRAIGAPIRKLFGSVNDQINLDINSIAFNLGKGGAAIIGSFAAGIIKGGTYVLQAVTAIAQIVADFLMGFSPPKRGILHGIDKGGENVATAWTDGFLGGVTGSFDAATQFVNDRLGTIASMSRDQLQAGLAGLDLALRPFKESLAIVKADMEAIAGFTDPAMKILERQRNALLKAFGQGKGVDIEGLRTQDRQIGQLKELKEFQQDQIDKAELQLALASAQQAQQRALYGIALDRLGAEEKLAGATKETGDAAEKGAKEASSKGGGGAAEPGKASPEMDMGAGGAPDMFSSEGIEAARAQILATISGIAGSGAAGIQAGLAESGVGDALAGLQGQAGALGGQLGRIAKSNPVQAIAKKFDGLKDAVSGAITDFQNFFNDTFDGLFGENGSITATLNKARDKFNEIFINEGSPLGAAKIATEAFRSSVDGAFKSLFGADGTVTGFLTSIKSKIDEVFGGGEGNPLQTAVTTIGEIKTEIEDALGTVFEMDVSAAAQTVYDAILGVFEEAKRLAGELASSEAVTSIKTELKGIMDGILDELEVIDVDAIVTGFENVLARIQSAIESFPTGVLEKGKEIVDSVTGALSGVFGGGEEDTVSAQRGGQDSAQSLLQGLTIGLPEETRAKLQEVGGQITAAIALGISGEEAVALITDALTGLYDQVSTTFTSLFIGEESILFLAQTGLVNFVLIMTEQLELLRSTFETTTLAIDSYLTSLFVNEGGTIPRLPLIMQGVMDQIIDQFMRLTNEGEGTLRGALASLTTIIRGSLVNPVVAGMEAMANSIINGMNQLIIKFNALPIPFSIPLMQYITVTAPGFAKGTLGYGGAFMAGERGRPELIMPAKNNPLSVFPNKATMALQRLASMPISQPAPMPVYINPPQGNQGNSNMVQDSYNSSKNLTVNAKQSMTRLEYIQLLSKM